MPSFSSKRRPNRRLRTAGFKLGQPFWAAALASLLLAPAAQAGPWAEHEAHMTTFNAKLFALEREVNEMIERKRHSDGADPKQLKETLDEMAKKHKELEAVAKEREEELAHMRFQHPEKGDKAEREYVRFEVKSLEQMEADQGIDGKLDRIKRVVEIKYRVEPRPKATPAKMETPRLPASEAPEERITLRK